MRKETRSALSQFSISQFCILHSSGNKNPFGLNVFVPSSGQVTYKDKSSSGFTFTSTRIASVVKNGNQATIQGDGTVDDVPTTFTVTVVDNGEPGKNDSFSISLGTGYSASGTLGGGNVQVK